MSSIAQTEVPVVAPLKTALTRDDVPVGTPLEWPVTHHDGALILERGAIVTSEADRDFLFQHFQPHRGDADETRPAVTLVAAAAEMPQPSSIADMHLTIGALLGVRSQIGL